MKVLVVGSGGREHAICTSVAKSPRVDKIYCAPGNAGIAALAECVPIGAMEFDKLVAFAKEKEIDFTIVGMDDPLVGGIVDVFEAEELKVFGPRGTCLSGDSKNADRFKSGRTGAWKRRFNLQYIRGSKSRCQRDHGG